MQPTSTKNTSGKGGRIVLLDVFRGFALLGIFVVNIVIMNSTFLNQDNFLSQWTGFWDTSAQRILQLFFYTKFFPIFSLLFGLGISIQAMRMIERKGYSYGFFLRRMSLLFLFGLLHIVLLWSGDVLHLYAILGLLVPFFLRMDNRLLWLLLLGLLLYPAYDALFEQVFEYLRILPGAYLSDYSPELVRQVNRSGGFQEQMVLRLAEYQANLPMLLGFLAPIAMALFLLGLYIGKNRLHYSLEDLVKRLTRPMLTLLLITTAYRLVFLFVLPDYDFYRHEAIRPWLIKGMVLSDVYLGVFYLWGIGWMWQRAIWKRLISPLQYAGRMALTNYVAQSVIGVLLFTSAGLASYETLSPKETLIAALVAFGMQVLLSKFWLRHFQFGPLEWVWRCLTYGRWFAFKREEKRSVTQPKT